MKKTLLFTLILIFVMSCTTREEPFDTIEDSAIQQEIFSISPALVSQVDFTSVREIELEGVKFTVLNFKHNATHTTRDKQYLIQDQNLNWVEITGKPNQIGYRDISTQTQRDFDFIAHPDHDFKVVNLISIPTTISLQNAKSNAVECTHCTHGYIIDVGLCTLTTTSMAISDGPLPFADYYAVVFFIGCENKAYRDLQDCVKHCLYDKK